MTKDDVAACRIAFALPQLHHRRRHGLRLKRAPPSPEPCARAAAKMADDSAAIAAALSVPVPFVLRFVSNREHAALLFEARAAERARGARGAAAARALAPRPRARR